MVKCNRERVKEFNSHFIATSDLEEASCEQNLVDADLESIACDDSDSSVDESIDASDLGNSNNEESIISDNPIEDKSSEKSKLGDGEKTVHTITEANYSSYFDSDGNLANSLVKANDTINLSGNFSNKKFIINIPLTITSTDGDAILKNSPIYYQNVNNENFAYDAVVSNLKIESNLANISAVWVLPIIVLFKTIPLRQLFQSILLSVLQS